MEDSKRVTLREVRMRELGGLNESVDNLREFVEEMEERLSRLREEYSRLEGEVFRLRIERGVPSSYSENDFPRGPKILPPRSLGNSISDPDMELWPEESFGDIYDS